ncbi:MAG TPA: hypothetical protein VLH61_05365 [Bacteroidales bacterium]|nr:hypothetical protein [Bacteroidales bacterium]
MKTLRKNLLLLAFGAGALFLIGNNLLAQHALVSEDADGITSPWECVGQRGIPRTAANGKCICLHDSEVNSGNVCNP